MKADFLDAHQRHWDDAERLLQAQRWANADHLYGMAAECGLKQLTVAHGMQLDPKTGNPKDKKDWKHVNDIWARFESYRSGRLTGIGDALPTPSPFADWDVTQRYAHQSSFDEARAQAHQAGAMIVCELIKQAQRTGMLT